MYAEATAKNQGELDQAKEEKDDLLGQFPNSDMLLKRGIAMEISRGNLTGALDACRSFLDLYCNDVEVWQQYANLALQGGLYKLAAFGLEEVMMAMPQHIMAMTRYADVQYSLGKEPAIRTAVTYYGRVIEVTDGECTRALYGVIQAVGALLADKAC